MTTPDVPPLSEALEIWRIHSSRFVSWVLFHEEKFRNMQTIPAEYHDDLAIIARGLVSWDGNNSLMDHLIEYAPSEGTHVAQLLGELSCKSGSKLLESMRYAYVRVEVRRAIISGDLNLIQAALNQLQLAKQNLPDPWQMARKSFPRIPVPWSSLAISESIKQLARAGAVTPDPLPGAVVAILAGIIGRVSDITPKDKWKEPLIFWHADIRDSGDGKTHPARMLISPLYDWQKKEDERYRREAKVYNSMTKEERKSSSPPTSSRSFFATDATLEGLRTSLEEHPTGGITILLDELSAFFTGQDQYKNGKGTDRESWLCLHDGNPARVVRAGKVYFIYNSRVQLYGGIQPLVFRQALMAKKGIFKEDGTLFRFLFTFSRSSFHELTEESWSHKHEEEWVLILSRARSWSDRHKEAPWHMELDHEAAKYLYDWRNELYGIRGSLPRELTGFIPKAISNAVRLTGLIHCLNRFAQEEEPLALLTVDDLKAGIAFSLFYLGQTVDAMYYLFGKKKEKSLFDMTDPRVPILARVFVNIESDIEEGRVAVGYVRDSYNSLVQENEKFRTSKAMGAFLRTVGLTISSRKHNWQNKRNVYCLVYDEKFKALINQVSNVCDVCQPLNSLSFGHADIERSTFAMSEIQ